MQRKSVPVIKQIVFRLRQFRNKRNSIMDPTSTIYYHQEESLKIRREVFIFQLIYTVQLENFSTCLCRTV